MQGHDQIGPQRYRESFGRYYDDFTVGDVYEHRPGRTITESDNTWFTLITMNQHPLHFDKEYAAKSEFKRPLVNSCLTLSMVVGMKEALVLLGKLPRAVVRPPLVKITAPEIARIRNALVEAGLLDRSTSGRNAA